jgi:hypothetical protein
MKKLFALSTMLLLSGNSFISAMEVAQPMPAPVGSPAAKFEYEVSLLEIEKNAPLIIAKANELMPKVKYFVEQYTKGGYTGAISAMVMAALDGQTRDAAYSLIGLLNVTVAEVLKLKNADASIKNKAKVALALLATNPSVKGLLEYSVQIPYIGTTLKGNLQTLLTDIAEYL